MNRHIDDSGALLDQRAGSAGADGSSHSAPAPTEPGVSPPAALDFLAVYTQHFDFACRSLRVLGVSGSSIEDAAQDVFGVVSRRLPEFAGNSSLKTWIFAIVQRVAANYRRSRRRKERALAPLFEEPQAHGASPEEHAQALQAAALVQSFCDGLDENRRALLVLALIEGVPARELAPSLGIPLFTVYSRIRSLRAALERFLQTHQVAS
jgi:RNA polymerase sigma-70 factor (ECF subfamily)